MSRKIVHMVLLAVCALIISPHRAGAQAADAATGKLKHAGITERLGDTVDLDARFLDETGKSVRFGDYVDGKHPVVLTFAYHNCPMLCPMVLHGLAEAMSRMKWTLGNQYRSVTVSISPEEGPDLAKKAKKKYLAMLNNPKAAAGWSFLTGKEADIDSLAESAGFEFERVGNKGQFGHAAAVILLSPKGVVTRYLYGITYSPFDLRAALVEASQGQIGNIADRFIMFCFHYDPAEGSYVPHAWLAMRLMGGVTLLLVVGFLFVFWRKERQRSEEESSSGEMKEGSADE